ncbi:hypothetical protein ES703_51429 [subsurface metagenome]
MDFKTNKKKKFPGFFECEHHDRLAVLLEDKPPTLCRNCFKRINGNLALYLGLTMTETLRLENIVVQNGDMIDEILDRLEGIDKWIERLAAGKTNEEGKK